MKRTAVETIVILIFIFLAVYWVMKPRTVHPRAYSEKNFSQIQIGMSTNEVVTLIGNPFGYYDNGYWAYSGPGHGPLKWSGWSERGLTVSNGVVVQFIRSYRYYED